MSEWKEYKLGEVINLKRGYDLPNSKRTTGQYPIVSSSGITDYPTEFMREAPGVVTGRYGTIGQVFYIRERYWPLNTALYVTDFFGNNPKFIYYFLKDFDFEKFNDKSTVPGINRNHVHVENVTIPPPAEQTAIASILSSLDDKIDLLHHQNQTLEKMAETLFRQWFVEEAKEEWEEVKIKDFEMVVTDFVANGSFESLAKNVQYKSTPDYAVLIRLTDFNKKFQNDFVYVSESAYNFLKKSRLDPGDIIISNVGEYSGTVFKCPQLPIPMTLGPNSIVIKSKFNNFFYLLFKSQYGQFLLDGIISGSAQPKFNKTSFRDLSLRYPSKAYIKDFEELVSSYFEGIELNNSQIRTLTAMRDNLLPKLMSGEVRVDF